MKLKPLVLTTTLCAFTAHAQQENYCPDEA